MQKIVFASDELSEGLDDRVRFSQWVDIYCARYGDADISRVTGQPFSARTEFGQIGDIGLVQFAGTIDRIALTASQIAARRSVGPIIGIVIARTPLVLFQHGRTLELAAGQIGVVNNIEPCDIRARAAEGRANGWLGIALPASRLASRVRNVEDLVARPLDIQSPALRHLQNYLNIVADLNGSDDDPLLAGHVSRTVEDLIALALGAERDEAEIARMRGVRAAWAQEIIRAIRAGFASPAISPTRIALKLGISVRYMHDILQETGASFTDRVTELRLQKGRTLLDDHRTGGLKVTEIVYRCGFSDVSYFNRCFRRRFGCSPTQYRSGNSREV